VRRGKAKIEEGAGQVRTGPGNARSLEKRGRWEYHSGGKQRKGGRRENPGLMNLWSKEKKKKKKKGGKMEWV